MTNTPNEIPDKIDALKKNTPTSDDVLETYYTAHDNMVRDIQQGFSGKFDIKAADIILNAMKEGSMSPEQAIKGLIELGAEPQKSTKNIEKATAKGIEVKGNADRDQANSMYEAIANYQGSSTKSQIDAATVIIMQMQSGKISPQEAIASLSKI